MNMRAIMNFVSYSLTPITCFALNSLRDLTCVGDRFTPFDPLPPGPTEALRLHSKPLPETMNTKYVQYVEGCLQLFWHLCLCCMQ